MSDNFTDIHAFVKESQTLYSWTAPMRPYKKKGKRMLRFFLAVALLLSIIILFFGDAILLLPVWAVLFLFYIMTITPPPIRSQSSGSKQPVLRCAGKYLTTITFQNAGDLIS